MAIAFVVLLVLGLATEALAARKARATGFYRLGRGQVNLPMQFVLSGPGMTGGHSIPLGFPNDDAMLSTDVSLVNATPATVVVPMSAVDGSYSALLALMGTDNVQITTMFTIFKAPGALVSTGMATFSAAGGPGSFTFCPGTAPGVAAANCPGLTGLWGSMSSMGATGVQNPAQGTGTRNGRVVYTGGSGFGGVSQVLLGGGGLVTRPGLGHGFGSPVFWAAQEPFGGGLPTQYQVIGGGFASMGTASFETNMLNGATYTQPKTAPTTMGTISSPQFGPQVTFGNALTSCPSTSMGGAYPNIPLTGSLACVVGSGPVKSGGSGTTTNTGFPFTTGTVFAQQSTNGGAGYDYFTITGSDARTAKGIGNITLVAGGLALRTNQSATNAGGSVDTISMTISEKAPSMSAGGFAAAAVLMVLAAGYAMRRRF